MNTVLNEHQLVLDIVSFVALGDFPRSRLGEKQRGKVLANWVSGSKKMQTIAQFSIRDPDAEGSVTTVGPNDLLARRGSAQSGRTGGGSLRQGAPGSSLRHVESLTNMPVAEEGEDGQLGVHTNEYIPASDRVERSQSRNDATPTNENPHPFDLNNTVEYSPIEPLNPYDTPEQLSRGHPDDQYRNRYDGHEYAGHPDDYQYNMQASYNAPLDPYDPYNESHGPQELAGSSGGLRVANVTSSAGSSDWEQEALRSMNIGGSGRI